MVHEMHIQTVENRSQLYSSNSFNLAIRMKSDKASPCHFTLNHLLLGLCRHLYLTRDYSMYLPT